MSGTDTPSGAEGNQERPVRVGAMLFTLVDPTPGYESAYNRWYERDHQFAGCTIGPGWFSNRRWVATRALKDARFPTTNTSVADPTDAGSYLAVYWILAEGLADHLAWSNRQVFELYNAGRGFDERRHAHTAIYTFQSEQARDPDPVPVELALQHPFAGLVSVHVDRVDGVRQADFDAWFATTGRNVLLATGSPVALVSSWRPVVPRNPDTGKSPMELGTGPGSIARTAQVCFLDGNPLASMDLFGDYAELVESSGLATVQLVAPFIPTLPGTDTYADRLW